MDLSKGVNLSEFRVYHRMGSTQHSSLCGAEHIPTGIQSASFNWTSTAAAIDDCLRQMMLSKTQETFGPKDLGERE